MNMAKKRMSKEPYKAKKLQGYFEILTVNRCIFHGLRYLTFAIQVVQHQRIIDYSAANHFLEAIKKFPSDKWEELKGYHFWELLNQLQRIWTSFQELAETVRNLCTLQ
jgi:hypothetical protein